MAGLLLILATAFGADCDPSAALDAARDSVLALDLEGGRAKLQEVEDAFACGPATNDQIARFWIVTGSLASFEGDEASRDEALRAARAASTTLWIDAFGDELKAVWSGIAAGEGSATLRLSDLPEGYLVKVDGAVRDGGTLEVTPGLHLIQATGGDHVFGRVVRATEGDDISLPTGLPELPKQVAVAPDPVPAPDPVKPEPKPKPDKPPREPGDVKLVAIHVGLGVGALVGPGFDLADVVEPAAKIGPLVEVGAVVRPAESAWARVALGADIALGSRFVYLAGDDTGKSLPLAPALMVSGGLTVAEKIDVGALVGLQLPSRVPLRAVAAYGITDMIRVEARGGVNLIGEQTVENGARTGSMVVEPGFALLGTLAF
ncbi:MAG: hypothetical protein H6737_10230 [Alphaproteobacteria bacterium]|nr:hypothetical protein [Alphaproteobacteria bacterium]